MRFKNFKLIKPYSIFLIFITLFLGCKDENKIPQMKIYDYNNSEIYTNSFTQKDLVFCYLNPECYTCVEFLKKLERLENPKYYFVVVYTSFSKLNPEYFNYKKKEFYKIFIDKKNEFPQKFNLGIFIDYPTFVIFENGKYIKTTKDKNNLLFNKNHL